MAMEDKTNQSKATEKDIPKDSKEDGSKKSTGENSVTSNSPAKERVPAEHKEIDAQQDKRPTPSTSKSKGTEEPGSDKGPGGTGW